MCFLSRRPLEALDLVAARLSFDLAPFDVFCALRAAATATDLVHGLLLALSVLSVIGPDDAAALTVVRRTTATTGVDFANAIDLRLAAATAA